MKKVIIEQYDQVISLEDVTDDMIIGIEWESGKKSFLIKDDKNSTVSIDLQDFTTLNHWNDDTHKDYIKNTSTTKKVFVFDSPKELARWLAE